MQGTMLHIWWDCPRIQGVFSLLRQVTGVSIPQQLQPLSGIPRSLQQLFLFFLFNLSVKISIAGAWKKPLVSLRRVKHKTTWIMVHEQIASEINKVHQFEKTWDPWDKYMHIQLTPFFRADLDGSMSYPRSLFPSLPLVYSFQLFSIPLL